MNDFSSNDPNVATVDIPMPSGRAPSPPGANHRPASDAGTRDLDADFLRNCAWDICERQPADKFTPSINHVGLAMVSPCRGFAHWRILPAWIDRTAGDRGAGWHDCRMILRLYDVSYIEFNGLNSHRIQDCSLPYVCGHMFFDLPRAGTWQLAEVGFLLRSGEFLPAARSEATAFAPVGASAQTDQAALLVDDKLRLQEVGNVWDQEAVLAARRAPKLRQPLHIAAFAFPCLQPEAAGLPVEFVIELAAGLREFGHDVQVFVPANPALDAPREIRGVRYQPFDVCLDAAPLEVAQGFGRAATSLLQQLPAFDLVHVHEWMAGLGGWAGSVPTVLSITSLETTRCNGVVTRETSTGIQEAEQAVAARVDCVLAPDWLRPKAQAELRVDHARVHAFSMEGRLPNEWDCQLDYGQVKGEIGVGPLDRMILFVGPLEHAAGVDLIVESLPILLQRWPSLRAAFAGGGNSYGPLVDRAHQLRVAYAVRLLGHVGSGQLTRLLRAAEALVLPSRYRVPLDDAVVDLARRAGRPVVTTHGGPAHLVRHEETGIVTYDNPGSMVWALDRILGDPVHAQQMGHNGRVCEGFVLNWNEVARHYLEICAATFPQLTTTCG